MNYGEHEQEIEEIDLLELCFTIVRKWKTILVTALVFAILLGGYKGVTSRKTVTEEQLEQLEACRSNVESIQASIDSEQEYMSNSVWYRLNTGNTVACKTVYYVTFDESDLGDWMGSEDAYADSILRSYQEILTGNTLLQELAQEEKTEATYLREIIDVITGEDAEAVGRFLTITVYHDSEENAQRIMDELVEKMDGVTQEVTQMIGSHELRVMEEGIGRQLMTEQIDNQTIHNNNLAALQESLQAKQAELAELESQCSTGDTRKSIAKFGIFGMLLGIVLAVIAIALVFILSDKVNQAEELKRRYHIPVLGKWRENHPEHLADRLIDHMQGKRLVDRETALNIAAGNLANYAVHEHKILMIGLAGREAVEAVAQEMQKRLPEKEILCGGNLNTDVDTIQNFPQCDGVVLVEACGVSSHADIVVEIEQAQNLQKKLIGCIVLE